MKVKISGYKKDGRKVSVKVSNDDTYSLDNTLAHIIYPALCKFRDKMNGYPYDIDIEDIPLELREDFLSIDGEDKCWLRWKFIVDEMVWVFGEISSGNIDEYTYSDLPENRDRIKRVENGLKLFGNFYRSLWW